jgi:murein DD-endopeptidase MepM/ murein hydrolase activator NlpD
MSLSLNRKKSELGVLLKLSLYSQIMRSRWTDVLMSPSFSDAFARWYGLRRTREKLHKEISDLVSYTSSVEDSIAYFSGLRMEHELLMTEELSNMDELSEKYRRSRNLLDEISRQEDRIKNEIARQQAEDERLVGVIRNLLTAELADADNKMEADVAASYTTGFESEKRSLSWPVSGGVLTRTFGIASHPRFKNIKTDNKGIDMLCPARSQVSAVYDGMVLLVVNQPPYRTVVIINHGRFSSAYYHLSTVEVSKGQRVEKGQHIGNIATNNGDSNFHFEIWDGNRHVNPQDWLRPRI